MSAFQLEFCTGFTFKAVHIHPHPFQHTLFPSPQSPSTAHPQSRPKSAMCPHQGGICRGDRCHVLVTEFRGMALNGLFCAVVLRPLDLVLLVDFTYRYHPGPHPHKMQSHSHTNPAILLSVL